MPAPKRPDPIGEVAAAVVASDPAIQQRVRGLVNALLDDAEYTIRFGNPTDRANLMRVVVPSLLRSMQGAEVNAEEAAAADAYRRMMATLRGDAPVPVDTVEVEGPKVAPEPEPGPQATSRTPPSSARPRASKAAGSSTSKYPDALVKKATAARKKAAAT